MHEKEYLQEAIPKLQAYCRPRNGSVKLHKDEDNAIAITKLQIAKF
jgi:hypothetical protein